MCTLQLVLGGLVVGAQELASAGALGHELRVRRDVQLAREHLFLLGSCHQSSGNRVRPNSSLKVTPAAGPRTPA
jgi:hypothetical protein